MELLKFRAHSKVAKVNLKSLKKALKEKEVESAKKLHEEIFS